jgi:hypothetical protein
MMAGNLPLLLLAIPTNYFSPALFDGSGAFSLAESGDLLFPKLRRALPIFRESILLDKFVKQTAQGIIEIGQRLIEVKEKLGHGNWLPWLKTELDWSQQTASNFMRVAQRFKLPNIGNLDFAPTALYLLASSSEEAREEALSLTESGEKISHACLGNTRSPNWGSEDNHYLHYLTGQNEKSKLPTVGSFLFPIRAWTKLHSKTSAITKIEFTTRS